jgi:hypothetical protein
MWPKGAGRHSARATQTCFVRTGVHSLPAFCETGRPRTPIIVGVCASIPGTSSQYVPELRRSEGFITPY